LTGPANSSKRGAGGPPTPSLVPKDYLCVTNSRYVTTPAYPDNPP
jgi:hypothetical protein